MTPITKNVRMDFLNPISMDYLAPVHVVQGDAYSRFVAFALYNGGAEYRPPSGSTVTIGGRRSNGTFIELYSKITLPSGATRPAATISGNIVTIELSAGVCRRAGEVSLTVQLLSADGSQLNSWPVKVKVEEGEVKAYDDDPATPSESAAESADRASASAEAASESKKSADEAALAARNSETAAADSASAAAASKSDAAQSAEEAAQSAESAAASASAASESRDGAASSASSAAASEANAKNHALSAAGYAAITDYTLGFDEEGRFALLHKEQSEGQYIESAKASAEAAADSASAAAESAETASSQASAAGASAVSAAESAASATGASDSASESRAAAESSAEAAESAAERAESAAKRAEAAVPSEGQVVSVNGKGGIVMLSAADVGALPRPESISAGGLLRVQNVEESTGNVTLETVAPADLSQAPTADTAGPVRVSAQYGITVLDGDLLSTAPATQEQLDAMTDSYAPVPPAQLPYGVKKALAAHADAADWTEDEKAAARGALGAAAESEVMHTSAYDENGDGMVDTAEKTAASLILRMNGGVTEGIDQFTFNGSSAKVVDITPAAIGSGGLRMTKAWENTSATSNFAPQSIILPALADGSHYEAILVHYKPDRLFNSFDDSALIFPGTYTSVRNYVIGNTYKDVEIYTRQIAYNILSDGSMKVTVDNCVYYPDSSSSAYANNLIVPVTIYGIKNIS